MASATWSATSTSDPSDANAWVAATSRSIRVARTARSALSRALPTARPVACPIAPTTRTVSSETSRWTRQSTTRMPKISGPERIGVATSDVREKARTHSGGMSGDVDASRMAMGWPLSTAAHRAASPAMAMAGMDTPRCQRSGSG